RVNVLVTGHRRTSGARCDPIHLGRKRLGDRTVRLSDQQRVLPAGPLQPTVPGRRDRRHLVMTVATPSVAEERGTSVSRPAPTAGRGARDERLEAVGPSVAQLGGPAQGVRVGEDGCMSEIELEVGNGIALVT